MTRLLPAPFVAALLAFSACHPSEGAAPSAPPHDRAPSASASTPLVGTEWRLAALDGAPVTGGPLVTVGFSERPWDGSPGFRSLGGYDGCNHFGMGYRLDGDRFKTGGAMSDLQACGPPGGHVSDSLWAGFSAARTLRIEPAQAGGDRLTLGDSLGAERLAFVPRRVRPVDSAAVVSGRWRLDPAASSVTNSYGGAPGRYEVAFAPDGTYAGSAGCRTFGGRYRLDGDRLWVESYDLDDQACAPDDRMWDGPHGLGASEVEADDVRLVVHLQTGGRAVFVRPD